MVYDSRPLRNLQQPSALAPGCFGMRRTGSSLTGRCMPKQHERPSGRGLLQGCKVPSPEMPQAQRRGISSALTSTFRQTAAHRHPLWTYRTPHLVRQGLISGNGAPQPPTQRTEAASRCGCLTKSVIVDFFQGHLDRSRGHFFCIDRRKLFDFDLLL